MFHLRILGRRAHLIWTELPEWMQDGLVAWTIALAVWMLMIAVLLV